MDSGVIASAETISHGRRTHARTKRAWVLTVLGAIAAILTLDFIFSFLVSGWHYPKTPIREIRQYTEGISVSHFVPDGFGTYGNRLTGNPVLPNVPTVLILGDSHVVQEAVADRQTVGAVIENLSRKHSNPVNVRQYGWYWVMKIHKDCWIDLIDVRPPEPHGRMARIRDFVGRSHLMLALRRRSVL